VSHEEELDLLLLLAAVVSVAYEVVEGEEDDEAGVVGYALSFTDDVGEHRIGR
jgi:multisubunit Na+/H+ antiporter MnhE subunit